MESGSRSPRRRGTRIRAPGGGTAYRRGRKSHRPARCAMCGRPLNAVPTGPNVLMKRLAKSHRRPNRSYGGYLCPSCFHRFTMERALKEGKRLLRELGPSESRMMEAR